MPTTASLYAPDNRYYFGVENNSRTAGLDVIALRSLGRASNGGTQGALYRVLVKF